MARIEDIEATAGSAAAQGVIGSPTQMVSLLLLPPHRLLIGMIEAADYLI